MIEIKTIEEHFTIAQSNQIIEAVYKEWTVKEIKFLNIALSTIQKEHKGFKKLYIKVSNIRKLLGIKKIDYTKLEKFCDELHQKQIKVKFINQKTKKEGFKPYHWFSTFSYLGNGIIEFQFDENIEPFLLNLEDKLTVYQLKNILLLKSKYSIHIYMFIKRMGNLGVRKIKIKDFCKMLDIKENSVNHKNKFLKSRVLLSAKKELSKTDISFNVKFQKTKNSNIADLLTFVIYKNKDLEEKEKETNQTILNQKIMISNMKEERLTEIREYQKTISIISRKNEILLDDLDSIYQNDIL